MESDAQTPEDEVQKKLRGDAIGDTVYSETFVTQTLLRLHDREWNKDLEDSLCSVWDMTTETDVCDYFLSLSYPNLVVTVVGDGCENRCTEILIGMLANIYSVTKRSEVEEDVLALALDLLSSDDPLIIVQVVRFIKSLAHNSSDKAGFLNETVIDKFAFILLNSCNAELLLVTLDLVSTVTNSQKLDDALFNEELVKSSIVAYKELLNANEDGFHLDSARKASVSMIQIVVNYCAVTDKKATRTFLPDFVTEMIKILRYYCSNAEFELVSSSEELGFVVEALDFIAEELCVPYNKRLLICLAKMYCAATKDGSFQEQTRVLNNLVVYFVNASEGQANQDLQGSLSSDEMQIVTKIIANSSSVDF